jgi:hypothetical protein
MSSFFNQSQKNSVMKMEGQDFSKKNTEWIWLL